MVYPSWLGPKPRENTKTKNQNTLAVWVPKNEKLIYCSSTLALWPPPKRSNMFQVLWPFGSKKIYK